VLTLEKTSVAHRSCARDTRDLMSVPAGIWVSTLLQAWEVEMKEMPTRDDREVVLNVKTPPCLSVPLVEVELPYVYSSVPLPVKVLTLAIG
jgi:hypothetical protein